MLCGILCALLSGCSALPAVKLACSLVLLLAVLGPLVRLTRLKLTDYLPFGTIDSAPAVEEGRLHSQNAVAAIIKERTEAYILDKAAELGLDLGVRVTVSGNDPPLPTSVELSGTASPYGKLQLEQWIHENLNIALEDQLWTG